MVVIIDFGCAICGWKLYGFAGGVGGIVAGFPIAILIVTVFWFLPLMEIQRLFFSETLDPEYPRKSPELQAEARRRMQGDKELIALRNRIIAAHFVILISCGILAWKIAGFWLFAPGLIVGVPLSILATSLFFSFRDLCKRWRNQP